MVGPVHAQAEPPPIVASELIWEAGLAMGAPEPDSVTHTRLPDSGPRYARSTQDMAMILFESGVVALQRGMIAEGRAAFEKFLRDYPEHSSGPAARAFLAESLVAFPADQSRHFEAIKAYRLLSREGGPTGNLIRAAWRTGDLYREMGWFQESELAYQQALGRAEDGSFDKHRALVGLGFSFLGMRKWVDAEKTFEAVRKGATDPHLLLFASIGAGHALFRQGRIGEADALYAGSYQRSGSLFRGQPSALIRYAVTSAHLKHTQIARRLLLQFYNLYPGRPEAPAALLQVADSYQAGKQGDDARRFYAWVAARYPATDWHLMARLRLLRLSGERGEEVARRELPRSWVRSQFLGLSLEEVDPREPERWLREVADTRADSKIGSEAMFRLGVLREQAGDLESALALYSRVVERAGRIHGDPWPDTTSGHLMTLLRPPLKAALESRDDLTAVALFHRHGPHADRLYAGQRLLPAIADAHVRLGFTTEAARLYQSIIKQAKSLEAVEPALIGLGTCYLDQQDAPAAQRVFERYRLQFPLGRYAGDALILLLTAMAQQGDDKGTVRVGRQWLLKHPRDPLRKHVLTHVALALVRLNRPDEAGQAFAAAHRLGGLTTAELMTTYGDMLSKGKQHESAVNLYRQSLTANPTRDLAAWNRVQIARNLRDARRTDMARAAFNTSRTEDASLFGRIASVLERTLSAPVMAERRRP